MSKSKRRFNKRYDDYGYEDDYMNGHRDELQKHRQDKKLKNAIRSKNIYDLIDLEDDEDEYI